MPMLSSKYRRQRFSLLELLNGSLSPGNGCRIRCFTELLDAAEEVSRNNSSWWLTGWVQVSESTGTLSGFGPGSGLTVETDVRCVSAAAAKLSSQSVSLLTSNLRWTHSPRPRHVHCPTLPAVTHMFLPENKLILAY